MDNWEISKQVKTKSLNMKIKIIKIKLKNTWMKMRLQNKNKNKKQKDILKKYIHLVLGFEFNFYLVPMFQNLTPLS